MNLLVTVRILGLVCLVIGTALLLPLAIALGYGEPQWVDFLGVAIALAASGLALLWISRNAKEISERDGFLAVTVAWSLMGVMGALPYYVTGTLPRFIDALFESVSGFTTTGASVFVRFDTVSHGIFFWRSLTHWIGGMGIILLVLAILPALGIGGMQLYKREVAGPYSDKLTPRLWDTARALWGVYVLLTALEVVALYGLGLSWFDAVNHAFATIATGGFSTLADSVGGFHSRAVDWVIIFFMFLGGTNFGIHYHFLRKRGRLREYWEQDEWRWYAGTVVLASGAISLYLYVKLNYPLGEAITQGTFQLVSIITTTGFGTDDYVKWGAFPQVVLFLAMIAGGCAGSTSGGVKWIRIVLLFKSIRVELMRLIHPRVMLHVKIKHTRVGDDIYRNIFAFVLLYVVTLAAATVLLTLDGNSILTSAGAVASAMAGVGPGLDQVGPASNYLALGLMSKGVLIACMLLGRLELMTAYVLFMPRAWRG